MKIFTTSGNLKFTVGILIILPWIQTISDGELKRTSTVSAANKVGRSQEFDANLFYQKLAVIIQNPLRRVIIYSFSLWSNIVESILLHVFKILASISTQLLFFVAFCCFCLNQKQQFFGNFLLLMSINLS